MTEKWAHSHKKKNICKWNRKVHMNASVKQYFCELSHTSTKRCHFTKHQGISALPRLFQDIKKMMNCTFTLKLNSLSWVFVLFYSAFTRSITTRRCTTTIHSKGSGKKVSEWQKLWFGVTQEWIRGARGQIDDTCDLKHACQPQSSSTWRFFKQNKRCSLQNSEI